MYKATNQVPLKQPQKVKVLTADKAIHRLLGPEILQIGCQKNLTKVLSEGTMQGASDSSTKNGRATCAWRIEPLKRTNCQTLAFPEPLRWIETPPLQTPREKKGKDSSTHFIMPQN